MTAESYYPKFYDLQGIVSTSATQQAVVQSFLKNHEVAINGLSAACRVKPVPQMYVLLGKTFMKAKKFRVTTRDAA